MDEPQCLSARSAAGSAGSPFDGLILILSGCPGKVASNLNEDDVYARPAASSQQPLAIEEAQFASETFH